MPYAFSKNKRDSTQGEISSGLVETGHTVSDTSMVGRDHPDITSGKRGVTFLIECKVPGERLTPGQERFHREWQGGPIITAYSAEDAIMQCEEALSQHEYEFTALVHRLAEMPPQGYVADACVFCGSDRYGHHAPDCVWVEAQRLCGKNVVE